MQNIENDFREDLDQKLLLQKAFFIINDIVERRNDIAHGVDDADENILSVDVILNYCDYFIALAEAIYTVVMREYVSLMISKKSDVIRELGAPIEVYGKNIVCLNNKNNQVRKGNYMASKNSKEVVKFGKINSLEVEGQQVDYISEDVSIDFGAKVDFQVHKKDTYYLVDS